VLFYSFTVRRFDLAHTRTGARVLIMTARVKSAAPEGAVGRCRWRLETHRPL